MNTERSMQGGFYPSVWLRTLLPILGLIFLLAIITSSCSRPNTQQLYFTSDRDGNLEIYSANLDKGTEHNITNSRESERFPRVSKDRKAIVFLTESSNDDIGNIIEAIYLDDQDKDVTDKFWLTRRS